MTYVRYHTSHTRERSPFDDEDTYYSRPLVRRNSKRLHTELFNDNNDDDENDDYPYSARKSSRALTIRQPSQLEKYNIWSNPAQHTSPSHHHHHHHHHRHHSPAATDDDAEERTIRYRYTTSRPEYACDDESDREREFRLKIKATFGRPRSSSHRRMGAWAGEILKRREKFEDEDWETRERERRGDWCDVEEPSLKEKTVRYRRIKRTRTDEWKPLSGWRRS